MHTVITPTVGNTWLSKRKCQSFFPLEKLCTGMWGIEMKLYYAWRNKKIKMFLWALGVLVSYVCNFFAIFIAPTKFLVLCLLKYWHVSMLMCACKLNNLCVNFNHVTSRIKVYETFLLFFQKLISNVAPWFKSHIFCSFAVTTHPHFSTITVLSNGFRQHLSELQSPFRVE